jgi:hypothetical protein
MKSRAGGLTSGTAGTGSRFVDEEADDPSLVEFQPESVGVVEGRDGLVEGEKLVGRIRIDARGDGQTPPIQFAIESTNGVENSGLELFVGHGRFYAQRPVPVHSMSCGRWQKNRWQKNAFLSFCHQSSTISRPDCGA